MERQMSDRERMQRAEARELANTYRHRIGQGDEDADTFLRKALAVSKRRWGSDELVRATVRDMLEGKDE